MQEEVVQRFIFFGDAARCPVSPKSETFSLWMQAFQASQQLQHCILLKQEHTNQGLIIDRPLTADHPALIPQTFIGDYVVTNQVGIGIGILTADCIPLVLCDEARGILAVVHAGWKGLLAGVIQHCLHDMRLLGASMQDMQVSFGAHAQSCCYQVKEDFFNNLSDEQRRFIVWRETTMYFDKAAYARAILLHAGVASSAMSAVSSCTICDQSYHSHRRSPEPYMRQCTMAWLR